MISFGFLRFFFGYLWIFEIFGFLRFFVQIFATFFGLFSKLHYLLIIVTEVITEHKTFPKISKNCIKSIKSKNEPWPKPFAGARSQTAVPAVPSSVT